MFGNDDLIVGRGAGLRVERFGGGRLLIYPGIVGPGLLTGVWLLLLGYYGIFYFFGLYCC